MTRQHPEALQYATRLNEMRGGLFSDAASELRRLYARVQELESIERQLCEQADVAANAYRELESEAADNARIIGASTETELALRAKVEELERRLESTLPWLVHYWHQRTAMRECHEALAACISLLKKTPKITQSMFVGKDQQAWGVQAKTVLEAALAAYAKQGEQQ